MHPDVDCKPPRRVLNHSHQSITGSQREKLSLGVFVDIWIHALGSAALRPSPKNLCKCKSHREGQKPRGCKKNKKIHCFPSPFDVQGKQFVEAVGRRKCKGELAQTGTGASDYRAAQKSRESDKFPGWETHSWGRQWASNRD